jgi:hypothetical protein
LFEAACKIHFAKPRKTKKQVSVANGHSLICRSPILGIGAANPSLSAKAECKKMQRDANYLSIFKLAAGLAEALR